MPVLDEELRHRRRRGYVVDMDCGRSTQSVGGRVQFAGNVGHVVQQHDPVCLLRIEDGIHLVRRQRFLAGLTDEHRIAVRHCSLADAPHDGREKRIANRRNRHEYVMRPTPAQFLRQRVRRISGFANRRFDFQLRLVRNLIGRIDVPRDRRGRNAGNQRNLVNRRVFLHRRNRQPCGFECATAARRRRSRTFVSR